MADGDSLPDDYLVFCGMMPIKIIGKKVKYYIASSAKIPIRYLARLPYVTDYNENDTLPYEEDQSIAISALAAIYALNKNESDISNHLILMGYGTNESAN